MSATNEPIQRTRRSPVLDERRKLYRLYTYLSKARDELHAQKDQARKARRLDELQFLREAIFHNARSIAHLQMVSHRRYNVDLEDLEVYK